MSDTINLSRFINQINEHYVNKITSITQSCDDNFTDLADIMLSIGQEKAHMSADNTKTIAEMERYRDTSIASIASKQQARLGYCTEAANAVDALIKSPPTKDDVAALKKALQPFMCIPLCKQLYDELTLAEQNANER